MNKLNEKVLEEFVNLFLEFFSILGKVLEKYVDLKKVQSKLLKYDFSTLTHQYIGSSYQDSEVSSLIARTFALVLKDFHQGNLLQED